MAASHRRTGLTTSRTHPWIWLAFVPMAVACFARQSAVRPKTPESVPIIVDTDAGADDLMAIAFLLSRRDVRIEAVTVSDGLAHVPVGGRNILRLLALARREDIPVYLGREAPLSGHVEFPAVWRKTADELPGVTLPITSKLPQSESAGEFLAHRLSDRAHPVRILALGPLTNLGEALDKVPPAMRTHIEIVIMGGAFHVRGNLGDGNAYKTDNTTAEWNIFVDPLAAEKVMAAGATARVKIRLVPLDATNQVPIDSGFLRSLSDGARTDLSRSVAQILATNRNLIAQGVYSAWDPLAAVALVEPGVLQTQCVAVSVRMTGRESGRTVITPGQKPNACVAFRADRTRFYRTFVDTLEPGPAKPR